MTNSDYYYVYQDLESGSYYYLDVAANQTTYVRPKDGIFLDPATSQPFAFPADDLPPSPPQPISEPPQPDPRPMPAPEPIRATRAISGAESVPVARAMPSLASAEPALTASSPALVRDANEPPPEMCTDREPEPRRRQVESFLPEPRARALPISLRGDNHELELTEFAGHNFRDQYRGHAFSRKRVPLETVARFQADPLKLPLLQAHKKQSAKAALECFKLILSYSGADPKDKTRPGGAATASRLLAVMMGSAELCDEGYFQLIKQTRHNPHEACLRRTWELFLIVASNIPATQRAEKWIRAHIYQTCRDATDSTISELAQFTYIRFNSRCNIGQPARDVPLPVIEQTPREVSTSFRAFGASIYEQLWNQRTRYPNATIPVTLHLMAKALIQKGAEDREGIFRMPGNQSRVKQMQNTINEGGSPYADAEINDLGSLFKSWFGCLPELLIDRELLPKLETAAERQKFMDLLGELPPSSLAVLKYLIGFLKRLCLHEDRTKMGAKNLAICFAPNLVDTWTIKDPGQARTCALSAQALVQQLIERWDTRGMYPLNESQFPT
jgi:hypothetical protein